MKRVSVRSRVRIAIVVLIAGIIAAWLSLTSESSLGDQVADALQQVASLFTPSTVTAPGSPSREALEDVVPAVKSGAFGVALGEAIVAHHEPRGEWFEKTFAQNLGGHATEGRWADGSSFVAASYTGDPGTPGSTGRGDGGVGTGNSGGSGEVGGGGAGSVAGGGTPGVGGIGSSSSGSNGTPPGQGSPTFNDPLLPPSVPTVAADPAPPLAAVPEPGTFLLLGSATTVLGAWRACRRRP